MINFEEELKKFYPSLEIEDSGEAIFRKDMTDMADLFIDIVKTDYNENAYAQGNYSSDGYSVTGYGSDADE